MVEAVGEFRNIAPREPIGWNARSAVINFAAKMNQLLASTGEVNVSQGHNAIIYSLLRSYGHSGNEEEHGRFDRPKGNDQHEEPRGFTQKGLRRFSKWEF